MPNDTAILKLPIHLVPSIYSAENESKVIARKYYFYTSLYIGNSSHPPPEKECDVVIKKLGH